LQPDDFNRVAVPDAVKDPEKEEEARETSGTFNPGEKG